MITLRALKKVFLCAVLGAYAAWTAQAADFYEVRGGIPNSQYYFKANTVGNQYLFFIGNSVLAGLKDAPTISALTCRRSPPRRNAPSST